jgi:hypothetical protein
MTDQRESSQRNLARGYKPPYRRLREQDNRMSTTTSWAWWNVNASGVTTYTTPWTSATAANRVGDRQLMADTVTPAYQLIRAGGGIVNNPMHQSLEITSGGDCGFFTYKPGTTTYFGEAKDNYVITGVGAPLHLGSAVVPQSWLTEAATKVKAKASSSAANVVVTSAKLRSTSSLLFGSACRRGKYIRQWAYGGSRWKGSNYSRIDVAATAWLEGRYGWRVFLREMDKYIDVINDDIVKSVRETARSSIEDELDSWSSAGIVNAGGIIISCLTKTTVRGRVSCGMLFDAPQEDWRKTLGLRWSDIPYSAWDYIPFSFVVNWFLNVDSLLGSLRALSTKSLCEWTTVETTLTTVRSQSTMASLGSGWVVGRHPVGSGSRISRVRTRDPFMVSPGIVLKAGYASFLHDARWIDLFALLYNGARKSRL